MLKTIKVFDNSNNKKVVYDKTFDSWDADPFVDYTIEIAF